MKLIKDDTTFFEKEPLEQLSKKQLMAFKHEGFWQCMDTKRDKDTIENILKRCQVSERKNSNCRLIFIYWISFSKNTYKKLRYYYFIFTKS